jgi:hypothetical protein
MRMGIAAPSSGLVGHSQAFVSGVKECKGRKSLAVQREARVRDSYKIQLNFRRLNERGSFNFNYPSRILVFRIFGNCRGP